MGHSMLKVHKEHPSLKIVVQDRPKVIEQAKQVYFPTSIHFSFIHV